MGRGDILRHYWINYHYIFGHPLGQFEFARDVRVSWKFLDSLIHTLWVQGDTSSCRTITATDIAGPASWPSGRPGTQRTLWTRQSQRPGQHDLPPTRTLTMRSPRLRCTHDTNTTCICQFQDKVLSRYDWKCACESESENEDESFKGALALSRCTALAAL
jgi:hypothetical protein